MIGTAYSNLGGLHIDMDNRELAMDYLLKSIKIKEKLNDKQGLSNCFGNLGVLYNDMKLYDKAILNYEKSNEIEIELNNKKGIANNFLSMGVAYQKQKNYNKSLSSYFKALDYYEEENDKYGKSASYLNLGVVYKYLNDYPRALSYYLKALEINIEIGEYQGIAQAYVNISSIYNTLKDYKKAINFSEKSLELSKKYDYLSIESDIYENLSVSYEGIGQTTKALEFYKLFSQTKDSLMNSEKFKLISEMESKYENEKHQLKIEKLEKEKLLQTSEIEKQNEKVKRQNTIIISFIFGFILIIIFLIIIYRFFKAKKKAYDLLSVQNVEIQLKNEEIITQRDIVVKQKNYIEEIHKEVTDSINYAKNLQSAILPESDFIKELLHEYFIIFKPRNIVSGDFYWISKRREWTLIAVADCTGHGVPGAFMSMLGISYLNEIVAKDEVQTASQVLNYLRLNIIKSLKQKGISGEQKDGMDIAFVAIDMETLELQFAGANNPLWVVKSPKIQDIEIPSSYLGLGLEACFLELKADKMPIAIHVRMDDFTNNEIKLQKGDLVYLFSDGYADQFGGAKGKKFLYRQFKELLVSNCNKSMTEQKENLENSIEIWMSNNNVKFEQTDDITVLGLKI